MANYRFIHAADLHLDSQFGVLSAEFPELAFYSGNEIEALEGLNKEEQEVLQQAKKVFGGAIFTE